ncbi:murein biosynthesis integral membrane protein MurJ [Candidatus Falkowbacteria bacterium RIFOXYB2_FULL_34_18]|uniref:Probable lipid II flippase MurJ n=1 Tax=Candidatus Falkowbacteria bacterium RIFOXYD2_FULL_34_120 TaxID=1798007 RepID=A0A1F5TN41_9BACT|nr:MAG: murein biosynthesis integral membrane protein MurJ [Candidatus Falkowbacteria bacterium RIFOXYC12_FULL_34_55]OGF28597.1 MAG: murein biosynthesis integral membrane protein MurJ [Candidatus Falkowbacteria bacterium RIFOXYB2_FULL_34_18]OGF38038.1 MAG: murein biosynthesis integral membrane protein MurJ [Candidatus Falkowbacteria bacterium RIFOXYC2_FULL_34_220]OGF38287.1 MAG: murein biosynthesis integral membrane protein MurJ [Candidatus Falkowbacteria bacterium RIFOXYD12_FULL_34_57]OGF40199
MIRKLFSGQINSITIAALLVALSSLISRFLGIFRAKILANEFGAGDMIDIYYAAFRVPDLVFNLLVLGALSAGFIPILTKLIKDYDCKRCQFFTNKKAWEFSSDILNIIGLGVLVLSLAGILFAPLFIKFIVPGFDAEKQKLTAGLTRIMFLSPIFLGISSVLGGILQSFKRFFVYSLAPIMYNIGIIIGALYFVPEWGIRGLAYGVVLGALMHMLIQLPMVLILGFRYRLRFFIPWRDKNIRNIFVMMVPRIMSLAISQINLIVITIIASTLASGSLTVFNFANDLQSLPIGVFGISFAIAAFPTLSSVAFDRKRLTREFSSVFRQILFFIVPATVLLLTLRAQIVRVIYGAGEFGWEDTVLTIDTLGFFSVSLFAQASLPLLVRIFYARHNAKTPFFVGLFSAGVNVVLSLFFSDRFGVSGLALAFSISSIINFILLWIMLHAEIGGMDEYRILVSAVKFSISAIACGLAVQGMKLLIWPFIDMTRFWGVLTQGLVSGIAGMLVFVAFCFMLRSEELFDFWNSIKRRLSWRKIEAGDQGEARGI